MPVRTYVLCIQICLYFLIKPNGYRYNVLQPIRKFEICDSYISLEYDNSKLESNNKYGIKCFEFRHSLSKCLLYNMLIWDLLIKIYFEHLHKTFYTHSFHRFVSSRYLAYISFITLNNKLTQGMIHCKWKQPKYSQYTAKWL